MSLCGKMRGGCVVVFEGEGGVREGGEFGGCGVVFKR